MPLFENGLKGNLLTGLAIGIGAAILAPIVVPILASVAKPLAKAAIKGGVLLYNQGRETFAEVSEVVDDLIAEAKAEMTESAATVTTKIETMPTQAEAAGS